VVQIKVSAIWTLSCDDRAKVVHIRMAEERQQIGTLEVCGFHSRMNSGLAKAQDFDCRFRKSQNDPADLKVEDLLTRPIPRPDYRGREGG
jgi:hypothetical protein